VLGSWVGDWVELKNGAGVVFKNLFATVSYSYFRAASKTNVIYSTKSTMPTMSEEATIEGLAVVGMRR